MIGRGRSLAILSAVALAAVAQGNTVPSSSLMEGMPMSGDERARLRREREARAATAVPKAEAKRRRKQERNLQRQLGAKPGRAL